jgi:light-regulated signal transduction histidine kinase (bacteriophytochrome)
VGLLTVGILPAVVDVPARLEHVFSNRFGTTPTYRMPDVPLSGASRRRGEGRSYRSGAPGSSSHLDRIFGMFRRLHTHDR